MIRQQRALCAALVAQLSGEEVRPPEGSAILWNAFMALSSTRTVGMGGPNPISFSEIEAWCRLTRTPLAPHHVQVITAMDRVWLTHSRDRSGKANAPEGYKVLPQKSATKLTPALFDAALG